MNTSPSWESDEKGKSGHMSAPLGNPPPYSMTPAPGSIPQYSNQGMMFNTYGNTNPGFMQQPAVIQPGPSHLDRLAQVLTPDRFTLFPQGKIGLLGRTIAVQLRDQSNRPVLSFLTTPGRNVSTGHNHHHHHRIRIGTVITLTDAVGQTLMTSTEEGQSMTVTGGDQVLGIINGQGICGSTYQVQSPLGDGLFQSVGASGSSGCLSASESEYNFMHKGVVIGRLGKSSEHPGHMEVSFASGASDARTKALVLFTAYVIYFNYFAETSCGSIGLRGFSKRIFFGFCLVSVGLMFIMPIILITTTTGSTSKEGLKGNFPFGNIS